MQKGGEKKGKERGEGKRREWWKGEGGKGESRGCAREESGGRWKGGMGGGREGEGRSVGREGEGKEWLEREGVIGGGRVVGGSDGRW